MSPFYLLEAAVIIFFRPNLPKQWQGGIRTPIARVDVKIFEGKSHFICGEPGWEMVADYILDWYENQ